MSIRSFAPIYGIVFLLVGIAGFIPGITAPHSHPDVPVTSGAGLEHGLFTVGVLHNIVHLLFGVWGLLAARSLGGVRGYFKAVAVICALRAIMGLMPAANLHSIFGLVPLYGNDVWLHVLLAAGAAYFGFVHRRPVQASSAGQPKRRVFMPETMRCCLLLVGFSLPGCSEQAPQQPTGARSQSGAGQGAGEIGGEIPANEMMVRYECADGTRFVARFPAGQPYILIEQAGRQPLRLAAMPSTSGFIYQQQPYRLEGTAAAVRWSVGGGEATACRGEPAMPAP